MKNLVSLIVVLSFPVGPETVTDGQNAMSLERLQNPGFV